MNTTTKLKPETLAEAKSGEAFGSIDLGRSSCAMSNAIKAASNQCSRSIKSLLLLRHREGIGDIVFVCGWICLACLECQITLGGLPETPSTPPANILCDFGALAAHCGDRVQVSFAKAGIAVCANGGGKLINNVAELPAAHLGLPSKFEPMASANTGQTARTAEQSNLGRSQIHILAISGVISFLIGMVFGYRLTPSPDHVIQQ